MKNGIIVDTSYFEGVDLDRPSIKHPIIERMQANARARQMQSQDNDNAHTSEVKSGLDDDLNDWLIHQDLSIQRHINGMVRHAMNALQMRQQMAV